MRKTYNRHRKGLYSFRFMMPRFGSRRRTKDEGRRLVIGPSSFVRGTPHSQRQGVLCLLGCLLALVCTMSAPSPIRAAFTPEGAEVTAFIGALAFQSWGLDDTAVYGARYTYGLQKRYALQGSLGIAFASFSGRVNDERTGEVRVLRNEDAQVLVGCGNFVYGFGKTGFFTPYTTIGVGWISRRIPEYAEGELNFNFGGGIRIPVGGSRHLALEIRQFVTSLDIGGFWPSSGRLFVNPSGAKRTVEISAGLMFSL